MRLMKYVCDARDPLARVIARPVHRAAALCTSAAMMMVLGSVPVSSQATVPEFAVTTSAGGWFVYSPAQYQRISATQYSVSDAVLNATLTDHGGGFWTLHLQAKQSLVGEHFPWQQQRSPLDDDVRNDIYYYPNLLGRTERAVNRNSDWTWYGSTYPGPMAAPLVVMADPHSAKIVAATNWPAKTVRPMYAAQRLVLRYDEVIPAGGSATYGALVANVTGNASEGDVPWQNALDLYKGWLDTKMGPIHYPAWMWEGQGMLNLQLQGYRDTNQVSASWNQHHERYPWLLMWGQVGPLGGSCCAIDPVTRQYYPSLPTMDSRFLDTGLSSWVRQIANQGHHAGFYSAPYSEQYSPGPRGYLTTEAGLNWFVNWNQTNADYGADSYYFDTLAREYWGDPARIVDLFETGVLPTEAMSEGIVDIYPLPALVSGSLAGMSYCGAPHKSPDAFAVTTYPTFVRYLLNDRLIYWGPSNDDYQFWGSGASRSGCDYSTYCANGICDYGVERQILLTGARIEYRPNTDNPVLDAIVSERQRVNWWPRRPRYLATRGLNLTSIPAGSLVEVTRFEDTNGTLLLAVSNPRLVTGVSILVDGNPVAVPSRAVSIIELGGGPALDTTPPSVPTGLTATAVSASQIQLAWNASTDNVGVTGYAVYRGNAEIGVTTIPSYLDAGLAADTTYSYSVSARDAANNTSARSASASATTLSASSAPQPTGVSPSGGTGFSQVFTLTYADLDGYADITDTYTMINASYTNGTNTCWFHYNRSANSLRLSYDDTPVTGLWQPSVLLGSAAAQENSQCHIDAARATATSAGTTLTITVPVTFTAGWSGSKGIYMYVRDRSGATPGYVPAGTWIVPQPSTSAPPPITDLTGSTHGKSSVKLSWTAPSVAPSGAVTSYDIRFSTQEITDASWASAIQVPNPPVPAAPGTTQTVTLTDLAEKTSYWFAIKSQGQNGTSPMSNIVKVTTKTRKR